MAGKTTNYGWAKPEANDWLDIGVISEVFENIDEQMKAVADAVQEGEFLPLTGGTLSGNLSIKKTTPEILMRNGEDGRLINIFIGSENIFYARNSKDSNNRTALMLYPESDNNIHKLLSLQKIVDGTASYYNVYGTHNVTCGTEDITAGTTPLTTGAIYQKYE